MLLLFLLAVLFVMKAALLLLAVPLVISEVPSTVPKPPTLGRYLNGSFILEYDMPVTSSTSIFESGIVETTPWYLEFFKNVQRYLMDCRKKTGAFNITREDYEKSLKKMRDCLTENFLSSLDNIIVQNEIDINPYVTIVREKNGGILMDAREDAEHENLISAIYKRFSILVDTHSFKLRFYDPDENLEKFEGRIRRHRHYRKAFPMIVAGYMVVTAFLIPLGFQFMAMIGGKALLLAKMAFFMSLFSGYKRLVNDVEYHHHGGIGHDLYHAGYYHHRSADSPFLQSYEEHVPEHMVALRKG